MAKDIWEKAEIVGKIAGAVLVPVAVGFGVLLYNQAASQREMAARMAEIAVGVLTRAPLPDGSQSDPLRSWAIEVLRNPTEVTPLSVSASKELYFRTLPGSAAFDRIFENATKALEIDELQDATKDK